MAHPIDCQSFLNAAQSQLMIDVRSPSEFKKAHIPGAINIPLFDDAERAAVGTTYKQQSKQLAVLQGLDFVGPKMRSIIEQVNANTNAKNIQVYCWRGGMRSGSVAWLLSMYGYHVSVLKGGYKAYRNHVLQYLTNDFKLQIIGGRTGVGKTLVLHQLAAANKQIVDLEAIANHKGSAFGMIGQQPQPSQEMFENLLHKAFANSDASQTIYVEDESRKIGTCILPEKLWLSIRKSLVHYIDLPLAERVAILNEQYGNFDKEILIERVQSIAKRIGPNETKIAIASIEENNMVNAIELCLKYYDKTYDYGLSQRDASKLNTITIEKFDTNKIIEQIFEYERTNTTY